MKQHIVQKAYLKQWNRTDNRLNLYSIGRNKVITKLGSESGYFYRNDFNVLDTGKEKYLPENIAQRIDGLGIQIIRTIDMESATPLKEDSARYGENRSVLATYTALQLLRTPKHRDESDKLLDSLLKHAWQSTLESPEDISLRKEDVLKEIMSDPGNPDSKEALNEITAMTEVQFKEYALNVMKKGEYSAELTASGHSKQMLRALSSSAEIIHHYRWVLLIPPAGLHFITSDNPCFSIAPEGEMNGLKAENSSFFFPLRPDVCLFFSPKSKGTTETVLNVEKSDVNNINLAILQNAQTCIVSKDEDYLRLLVKGYDYKNHRKTRNLLIQSFGEYTWFKLT